MRSAERTPAGLILFLIVLSGVCASSAMVTVIRSREQLQQMGVLTSERRELERRARTLEESLAFVHEKLGLEGAPTPEALRDRLMQELERYSKESSSSTFRAVLEDLVAAVQRERTRAVRLEESLKELQDHVAMMKPSHETQLAIERRAQEATAAELRSEQQRSVKNLEVLEDQIAILLRRLEVTTADLQNLYRQKEQGDAQSRRKIQNLLSAVRMLRAEQLATRDPADEAPVGKVVHIDARAQLVTLDIGKKAGVRQGMTFAVHRRDAATGTVAKQVATLEAVVVDENRCTARITRSERLQPILPGDAVMNPILRQGKTEGFALVGALDIDGDGKDESALLRRLIEQQGGRVSLRVDPHGAVTGRLTQSTRYVVMDDKPETASRPYLELLSRIHREAIDFGIPVLSGRRFAERLGYTPPLGGVVEAEK